MIIKSGGLLYLFDFDGTLSGSSRWRGLIRNNIDCFRSGTYLNPTEFDIRWSILTGRPRIDRWFLKLFCMIYGLTPERIFMAPTLTYSYKNDEENHRDKEKLIKGILDQKIPVGFTPLTIEKILYVDNDTSCIKYLNSKKESYCYLAVNVQTFFEQKIPINLI